MESSVRAIVRVRPKLLTESGSDDAVSIGSNGRSVLISHRGAMTSFE